MVFGPLAQKVVLYLGMSSKAKLNPGDHYGFESTIRFSETWRALGPFQIGTRGTL